MAEVKKSCTEVVNEVISRYSKVTFEKDSNHVSDRSEESKEMTNATEEEFWNWFCGEMKDSAFKKCFMDRSRDDFYGSLEVVSKQYEKRCK